jgi:serine/threonine protein phosphatase 1
MNTTPPSLVHALPSNPAGRDFVVGDLHGCFDLLDRLLDHVRFDPACDRLFSVGDLIDRGPDSLRSLEFLDAPWFYAVKGNHEDLLLEFFEPYRASGRMDYWDEIVTSDLWLNGGEWVEACYLPVAQRMTSEFDRLLNRVSELPLIWVVGKGPERFHVLHAELVRAEYRKRDQKVWLDADIDRWQAGEAIDDATRERLIWGRTLMMTLVGPGTPPVHRGLSTTYCGHTIVEGVRSYLSHVCLDTGAYRSGSDIGSTSLGLILHCVQEQWQICASYGFPEIAETHLQLPVAGLDVPLITKMGAR